MVTHVKPKEKGTGKKSGGQPGNKNALRHGFYANQFTADEKSRLNDQDATDVLSEIALLRVCIDRLTKQLNFNEVFLTVKNKDKQEVLSNTRDDHYLKQLNTLGIMAQSLATLTRTSYLTRGKGGDVNDAILRALKELRIEMGL